MNAVEIPVQVLLDGKPVRGLKSENFVVFQEKQRQEVTGFDAVDLLSLPEEKALEVPAPEYLLRVTVTDASGKAGTTTAPFVVAAATPGERS